MNRMRVAAGIAIAGIWLYCTARLGVEVYEINRRASLFEKVCEIANTNKDDVVDADETEAAVKKIYTWWEDPFISKHGWASNIKPQNFTMDERGTLYDLGSRFFRIKEMEEFIAKEGNKA